MPSIATSVQTRRSSSTSRGELEVRLPRLRRVLEEQRRFRVDQLAELATEEDEALNHSGIGPVEDLDASADSARAEVSTVIAAAARKALDDIEDALARMRSGDYGRCVRCGTAIEVRRLVALPQAAMCMECQRGAEVATFRHVTDFSW